MIQEVLSILKILPGATDQGQMGLFNLQLCH